MDIEWSEEDSDGFAAERINFVECGFRRGHPALVMSTFPSCLGFGAIFAAGSPLEWKIVMVSSRYELCVLVELNLDHAVLT